MASFLTFTMISASHDFNNLPISIDGSSYKIKASQPLYCRIERPTVQAYRFSMDDNVAARSHNEVYLDKEWSEIKFIETLDAPEFWIKIFPAHEELKFPVTICIQKVD